MCPLAKEEVVVADRALGSSAGKSQTVRAEVPAHWELLAPKMKSRPHECTALHGACVSSRTRTTA